MFLNPLVYLVFVALSIVVGTYVMSETENWLGMIPFVVFTVLFVVSLLRPVPRR